MFSRLGMLAATFAALILAPASHALAVTISGTMYEDTVSNFCSGTSNCVVLFAELPSALNGQFVTFTEISCTHESAGKALFAQLFITDNGTNLRRARGLPVQQVAGPGAFIYPLDFKVTGGPPRQMILQFYSLAVGTGNFSKASCTIVGRISSS